MKSTVCILTAGMGSRMGELGKTLNKAIFPYMGKAVISHILEKFPLNTNFVIAVGYKKEQVRDYLKIAHSNQINNFRFVNINKFKGEMRIAQ